MEIAIQLVTAFLGSLGFSILFKVHKKNLFLTSLGGFVAWAVYILFGNFIQSDVIRFFFASAAATIYSEQMARKRKTPATVFIVPSLIPLVPGGSLYQTFIYLMQQDFPAFYKQGIMTLLLAVAISGGILFIMTVLKMYQKTKEVLMRRLDSKNSGY